MSLSVIIPVFRAEDTLDRCVQSVAGQTFSDMEIILVDDGSDDGCPAMCDAWAEKDARVSVVHKTNGGLSDARNAALDVARGDYVTFVDSDDFLDTHTYSKVMPLAERNDITEFPLFRHYGSPWQQEVRFETHRYQEPRDYWLLARAYEHCYSCNKIYRRELFSDVRFPVGKVFEDVLTLPRLLQKTHVVATANVGMYYYCLNHNGITATAGSRQMQMLLDAHLQAMRLWCDDRYYMHVLNIQSDVCELTGQPPILPFRPVNPLSPGLSPTERMKAVALRMAGTDTACKLTKYLHRWKKPTHS